MSNYTIYIECMTFNHAPYIEDAMNGFCMQETRFPFVAVIMDDASSDGEPEVIKQYLHEHFDLEDKEIARNEETDDFILTFARHKENHNCFFAVYLLKYNHYSIGKAKSLIVRISMRAQSMMHFVREMTTGQIRISSRCRWIFLKLIRNIACVFMM